MSCFPQGLGYVICAGRDLGPTAQDAERRKNGTVGGADRNRQFVDPMLELFLRHNESPRPVAVHQFDDFLRRVGRPRAAYANEVDVRKEGLNGGLLLVPQQGPAAS